MRTTKLAQRNLYAAFNKALFKTTDVPHSSWSVHFIHTEDGEPVIECVSTWKVRSSYTGGLPVATKRKIDALDALVPSRVVSTEMLEIPAESDDYQRWRVTFASPVLVKYSVDPSNRNQCTITCTSTLIVYLKPKPVRVSDAFFEWSTSETMPVNDFEAYLRRICPCGG